MKKTRYPLKKQIICKKCGYRATSRRGGKKNRRYYGCLTQASHKTCTTKAVNANKLEKIVTTEVERALAEKFDTGDSARKMLFYWLREVIIGEFKNLEKYILYPEESVPHNIWKEARASIDSIKFFINQYEFHEKLCIEFSSMDIFKIIEMFVRIEVDFETKEGEIIFSGELEDIPSIPFCAK